MRIERKRHAMNLPQRFFQMFVRPSLIPCAHALARAGLVCTCRAVRLAGCVAFGLAFLLGVAGAEASSGGFFQQQVADGKAANAEDLRDMQRAAVSTKHMTERIPCEDGVAAGHPCKNIDLLAVATRDDMPGFPCLSRGDCFNDIWGWTDPETGVEYALLGRHDGVAFFDLSDPVAPAFVGMLPMTPGSLANLWRDIKVVNDHAVVVADAVGNHGMQVFDLAQLRDVTNAPATFEPTALYDGVSSAHNVVVNHEKDHVYIVGMQGFQRVPAGSGCGSGAHIVDMSDPANPEFAGCYNTSIVGITRTDYTHDAQCVRYRGPDARHVGSDICISLDEQGGAITDVTNLEAVAEIGVFDYPNMQYTHQGWLTEDHRYFFVNDEGDEYAGTTPQTRTLIYDVQKLDDPVFVGHWLGPTEASDHNLYVHEGRLYESNYAAGLRVMDISYDDELTPDDVREVAYFDTQPSTNRPQFSGAWSSYPYFESGLVIVSDTRTGLYVVEPTWSRNVTSAESEELPAEVMLLGNYPNPFNPETTIRYALPERGPVRLSVYDLAGREVAALVDGVQPAGEHAARFDGSDLPSGSYVYRLQVGEEVETRTMTLVK